MDRVVPIYKDALLLSGCQERTPAVVAERIGGHSIQYVQVVVAERLNKLSTQLRRIVLERDDHRSVFEMCSPVPFIQTESRREREVSHIDAVGEAQHLDASLRQIVEDVKVYEVESSLDQSLPAMPAL